MASMMKTLMAQEAKRLNSMNVNIIADLKENFELPVYMNVVTEDELPEDLTYFIIEVDDYVHSDTASKAVSENVTITMWSTNRPDPTLDHLMTVAIGLDNKLTFVNASNDHIIMEKTGVILNMFTANFKRRTKVGC